MTAEPNSLQKIKLYYEYTEDDAMHNLLVELHKQHLKKEREKKVVS